MKKTSFGVFLFVFILVGCAVNEETKQDILSDDPSLIDVNIPSEIVNQYGTLNMESKVEELKKVQHPDGSVTITLDQQSVEEISEAAIKLFDEFTTAIQDNNAQITNVSFTKNYSEWLLTVRNKEVLLQEGFLLAEELLMKNAFAYQLLHHYSPLVKIQYFTPANELIEEKMIRVKVATTN